VVGCTHTKTTVETAGALSENLSRDRRRVIDTEVRLSENCTAGAVKARVGGHP
jgi:hypothetical protein